MVRHGQGGMGWIMLLTFAIVNQPAGNLPAGCQFAGEGQSREIDAKLFA